MCSMCCIVIYRAVLSIFFFFKQKTAYDMRISDWSSDVCSSDLKAGDLPGMAALITDEMLEHYAVIARWDDLADALVARYGGLAERLVMYLAEDSIRADRSTLPRWGEVARAVVAA